MTPASPRMLVSHFLPVLLGLPLLLFVFVGAQISLPDKQEVPVKTLAFGEPGTGYYYKLTSYNVTQMSADSTHRSRIRISRVNARTRGRPENIQTLSFHPSLVDFDILCEPAHCYLVCVTSKTKRNVELYRWSRTQFDLQSKRDSFARPHSVKMFRIEPSNFYIAIAQDQLHLSPYRLSGLGGSDGGATADDDESDHRRFIGCALLKFTRGHERHLKYHQFIRLPFNPLRVHYQQTISANNLTDARAIVRPFVNHHLIFSVEDNWADPGASQVYSYIWQPDSDRFWPYRMPRGAEIEQRPLRPLIKLAAELPAAVNLTQPQEYLAPVESCFYQLERLLASRERESNRLVGSGASVWRTPLHQQRPIYARDQSFAPAQLASLTNITAQVIVHGNVTVVGSLIESPQISLMGAQQFVAAPAMDAFSASAQLAQLIKMHSPQMVENKFRQALFKLRYIREKLSHAIPANLPPQSLSIYDNRIRFLGPLMAREIQLAGVRNSNVRLNGIPFRQLENELVSLNGAQNIGARVVFEGRVVADVLEIHGTINEQFLLKDALDITNPRVQVIDTTGQNFIVRPPGMVPLEFRSIGTPEVILAHNASLNSVRLGDFITRDNRTQVIHGRKSFRLLSMARLDLEHPGVALNGYNLTHIARQAIRLRPAPGLAAPGAKLFQTLGGQPVSFSKPVRVNKLTLNNIINQHINLTSLIHDSIKTNDPNVQQIFGQKSFLGDLHINRLTTEGALNAIPVSQIFNLNPAPPVADHHRYQAASAQVDVPIEGQFRFGMPSHVFGSVSASLVNGIDLARRTVQRSAPNSSYAPSRPQLIRGHKVFYRPLRVINKARLVDPQELNALMGNETSSGRVLPYPLVNNIDLRLISAGLDRQMRQPSLINVDTLEIEGNLNIPSSGPPFNSTTLGSFQNCPLDAIRARTVLAGMEDQFVEAPIRVNSLRAKSIVLDSGPLNDFYFPQDFVLRTALGAPNSAPAVEPVYGVKTLEHLVVSPSAMAPSFAVGSSPLRSLAPGIQFDRGASVNQVPHSELQTFVQHEQQHSSTGERVFTTLNVYGNLNSKRINGKYWPDDILLKSLSSALGAGPPAPPFMHKRIYSHLIFANSSNLQVENQLVLRGPIQLEGRMNGANLTEFSKQSATYYDKDLYSMGRPIRNKVFLGGLTVRGEIRSQGLIDGVNFDEMRRRVVTVNAKGHESTLVASPKVFKSDVLFQGPVTIMYLNDLPVDHYLGRIRFEPDGRTLRVHGKKTITGALRINRNLYVRGLINGLDFAELKARAISLSPPGGELKFNQTLTVEGDVFMDNLWIDERNGTIDGVKLINLLPIGSIGKNELTLTDFHVNRQRDPYGRVMRVDGSLMDCQVSCDLEPNTRRAEPQVYATINQTQQDQAFIPIAPAYQPSLGRPLVLPAQPVFAGTSRPALYNQAPSLNLMRTTPPYSMSSSYQPPMRPIEGRREPSLVATRERNIRHLSERKPVSVRYEHKLPATSERPAAPDSSSVVVEQLEILRKHIISTSVIRLSSMGSLVVGFIQAPTNDIANLELPEQEGSHVDHDTQQRPNFLQLDQIDVPFGRAIHSHLTVGVATNRAGSNITSVFSLPGGRNLTELSVLPVAHPNSAMFLQIPGNYLLLISQDYSTGAEMCPKSELMMNNGINNRQQLDTMQRLSPQTSGPGRAESGIHVYLLNWMKNSSSPLSAYFDLYQTLDLPGIDSFDKFTYRGSPYVLAVSRALGKIYLLLMRGYTAFQLVSDIDAPMVERVSVMLTQDKRPVLVVHQTSGLFRVMEPVII